MEPKASISTNKNVIIPKKRKLSAEARKEERAFWIFISPWIIGFIFFHRWSNYRFFSFEF